MTCRSLALAVVAMACTLSATIAPALAQTTSETEQEEDFEDEPFDRDCMDDYGRNLCDQGLWSEIVGTFGVEPAEPMQAQGWRGVRVFTVNGYSNDMPMVSVLATGFDKYGDPVRPVLEVRGQGYRAGAMTAVSLAREAWDELYEAAERLQDLVAAAPERQSGTEKSSAPADSGEGRRVVMLCLHAWVTVTESLTGEGVTRRIRNACGDDPLFNASYDMSDRALRGFAHCNHIDPTTQRNGSTQLQSCLALDGEDKIASAEVMNLLSESIEDVADLADFLTPDSQLFLDSDARPLVGNAAAKALGGERFNEMDYSFYLFEGSADQVVVTSEFWRYRDDDKTELADVRHVWRRQGGQWRLAEITVGPLSVVE